MSDDPVADFAELLRLRDWSVRGNELYACCPSPDHDDQHPSWSLNLTTGAHYCFSCQYHGYILDIALRMQLSPGQVVLLWNRVKHVPLVGETRPLRWPLTAEMVEPYLMSVSEVALNRFPHEDVLRKYHVGCDPTNGLPVFVATNRAGEYMGVWAKSELGEPKYYLMGPPDAKERGALFGAHLAPTRFTVVCEGFYQALAAHYQTGYKAVAVMGTAVTEAQLLVLVSMSPVIVLFDGDHAGRIGRDNLARRLINARGWGFAAGGYEGDPDNLDSSKLSRVVLVENMKTLYDRSGPDDRGLPPL